MNLQYLIVDGL